MLYGFAMSKIADLLNELERTPMHWNNFIKLKVDIQLELGKLLDSTPDGTEAHLLLAKMHQTWRFLGGVAGTLSGYMSAISDLKSTLQALEELGINA
jgi:hypothetical protein